MRPRIVPSHRRLCLANIPCMFPGVNASFAVGLTTIPMQHRKCVHGEVHMTARLRCRMPTVSVSACVGINGLALPTTLLISYVPVPLMCSLSMPPGKRNPTEQCTTACLFLNVVIGCSYSVKCPLFGTLCVLYGTLGNRFCLECYYG